MSGRSIATPSIRNPVALVLLLIFAGAFALSIHVLMLTVGVPFPIAKPPLWAAWINQSATVIALLTIVRLAQPSFGQLDFIRRTLLLFLVLAMIRETLRGAIMNGVVTTGWLFALSGLPEQFAKLLALAALCVAAAGWASTLPRVLLLSPVVAAAGIGCSKLITAAFAPLAAQLEHLSLPDLYQFPYPVQVMIPAYLTFAEAVMGAALLARLVWPGLPGSAATRIWLFAVLVALVKGVLLIPFLFSFFMVEQSYWAGALSYSQFTLEFLALGTIVGVAWERCAHLRTTQQPLT